LHWISQESSQLNTTNLTMKDEAKNGTPVWDGKSMTQQDFMEKDTVLVLDNEDNVIGSETKRKSHEFLESQPRGVLHRAFSVFIFDESTGELLLQQRASNKITFPSVSSMEGIHENSRYRDEFAFIMY